MGLAQRIAVIWDGRIEQVGEASEVFRKPTSTFVAQFVEVENIFKGRVIRKEGQMEFNAIFELNGINIHVFSEIEGEAYISIRPEEILFSKEKLSSIDYNNFKGEIIEISDIGSQIKIWVDIGINIVVLVTRLSFLDMDLKIGMPINISFKPSLLHVFKE